MYTFEHPATEQTGALTDYRYIGSDPYNYVTFNNELWRIIGVFTVEDENGKKEQRIKIVKNEVLSSIMPWNSISPYENEWPVATLNTYLNGDYFDLLDVKSKGMVADATYYLGGRAYSGNPPFGTTEDMYAWERGTIVYSGRSTSWNGKIALIYPSDYTYTYALGVDNTCYTDGNKCSSSQGGAPINGWLYTINSNNAQWFLSPHSDYSNRAFVLDKSGIVARDYLGYSDSVRPTLYLSSSVKIIFGTGESDDPYQLLLN